MWGPSRASIGLQPRRALYAVRMHFPTVSTIAQWPDSTAPAISQYCPCHQPTGLPVPPANRLAPATSQACPCHQPDLTLPLVRLAPAASQACCCHQPGLHLPKARLAPATSQACPCRQPVLHWPPASIAPATSQYSVGHQSALPSLSARPNQPCSCRQEASLPFHQSDSQRRCAGRSKQGRWQRNRIGSCLAVAHWFFACVDSVCSVVQLFTDVLAQKVGKLGHIQRACPGLTGCNACPACPPATAWPCRSQ